MTRDDVRNKMHDYFDGRLSDEDKETVESYLEEYTDVAQEYELLSKLLKKAQSLPIGIKTPDTIVAKISDELLSQSLKKIEFEKQKRLREITESIENEGDKRKKIKLSQDNSTSSSANQASTRTPLRGGSIKKPIILFVLLVIIVGGYFALDYFSTNLPWQVTPEYGQYQVGNSYNKNTIDINEKLITQDSSKVTIDIPGSGKISVRSYSTIEVIEGKSGENVISLLGGNLEAQCNVERPGLLIKTIQANIEVLAGDFVAGLTDQGDLIISTSNASLRVFNKKEDVQLGRDHNLKVMGNGNIGIPYYFDADPAFVELLDKISFENSTVADVDVLLNMATFRDGITLFYLLVEAKNPTERLPIFLKLNEFYPVPPGVTQDGILKLNPDMLDTWLSDIEWQI